MDEHYHDSKSETPYEACWAWSLLGLSILGWVVIGVVLWSAV